MPEWIYAAGISHSNRECTGQNAVHLCASPPCYEVGLATCHHDISINSPLNFNSN